ncbi:MAG: methylphosphotriester-DNA--protein-cysteine methyltransferase family protein [Kordiimonadaceae bacterium]|nr:methylphosphotriester-DNA--protein-cysteine methyltransferase family protein [Kordiimonadaceae bacterium]
MEHKDRHILYQALFNKDPAYDGVIFFGVTSTGIFCRSICPGRKPKFENVLYFPSVEAAQQAGFRACKRCRPESRPGSPAWDGTKTTITRALRLLALQGGPESLAELSDKLGVTDRHLRRLFQTHIGKSPMDVKSDTRIKLATTLLLEAKNAMPDIAFASGFRSLRRFNDAFKKATGLSPSAWRKKNRA